MRWVDLLGYAASLAVLATFCMRQMVLLRLVALGSNILFALFGAFGHIYPVLVLHLILLPINVLRLLEIRQSTNAGLSVSASATTMLEVNDGNG